MTAEQRQRRERKMRLQVLIDHFGVEPAGMDLAAPIERYAAVAGVEESEQAQVYTFAKLDDAFEQLAIQVLEGDGPDGVYDLDTGDKIDIHVSTPIVTASEDQGITVNPLKDEETQ